MLARHTAPLVFLSLAALAAWPGAIAAPAFGVLKAKASAEPAQIEAGGKTLITVSAHDGLQQPIAAATVTISAASGYFDASGQDVVIGYTDPAGVFQAAWLLRTFTFCTA